MTQLLRFHIHFSSKIIVKTLPVVIALFLLNSIQFIQLDFVFLATLLSVYLPTIVSAHLLNNKFSALIRTFPVSLKQFVQSTYLYITILFSLIAIPTTIGLLYQVSHEQANAFQLYFTLGLFSFCLISTGGTIKAHFKSPANNNAFSVVDAFFYVIFILIAQTFIGVIFTNVFNLYLAAFIVPAVCMWIFYRQYKESVILYKKAEFL